MDHNRFDWDDANIGHIAEHGVTPDEAEYALDLQPITIEYQNVAGEQRIRLVGETGSGRVLTVVITPRGSRTRVVTAFPANRRQRMRYLSLRGRWEQ